MIGTGRTLAAKKPYSKSFRLIEPRLSALLSDLHGSSLLMVNAAGALVSAPEAATHDPLVDEYLVDALVIKVPNRGYHCKECGYTQAYRPTVVNHVRARHLKSKPFPCKLCDKRFPSEANRQIHIKKKHDLTMTSKEIKEWVGV